MVQEIRDFEEDYDTQIFRHQFNKYVSHSSSTTAGVTHHFWDMGSVTESTDMFKDYTNLVGQNGTTYNANYVDKTYARVDETGTPGYMIWIN